MRKVALLVATLVFLGTGDARADNWRDENPNQPNGYAASTFRYHHGTPGGDDGPANGYRASSFRSRHGLEGYMPPEESSGRWGGESSRWGGQSNDDSLAGSMMRRNFRKGRAEGAAMRYQSRQNPMNYQNQMGNYQNMGFARGAYSQNPNASALRSRLNARYNHSEMNMLSQNQGQPNYNNNYNYGRPNPAMVRAINQRPLGRMIQNSQGGFNRIYTQGY